MRLIDADALWDELTEDLEDGDVLYRIPPYAIDDAPTVDAVPVVRCRDCTHYNGHRHCDYFYSAVLDDDFCSYGEKRLEAEGEAQR